MNCAKIVAITGACLLFSISAFAADKTGSFYRGGGVGSVECLKFIASMEKGRSHGVGTLGYVQETQGYLMYVAGFRTGYNMAATDIYDVFSGLGDESLLLKLESICTKDPAMKFGDAVVSLVKADKSKNKKKSARTDK